MSWDEALFSFAWTRARRWKATTPNEVIARRIDVETERPRLETLARLLTGRPVTVTVSDDTGGLSGENVFLPRCVDFAPTAELNQQAMVVRIVWSSVVLRLVRSGVVVRAPEEPVLSMALLAPTVRGVLVEEFAPLSAALLTLEQAALACRSTPLADDARSQCIEATVRRALGASADALLSPSAWQWADRALKGDLAELPRKLSSLFRRAHLVAPVPLWGQMLPTGGASPVTEAPKDQPEALPGGTEVRKRVSSQVERVKEPEQQLQENPLVHSFEKVHTLEEYKGGSKRMDGDDELAAHEKALDELDLKQVVRSHQRARSVYRADVLLDGTVGDLEAPEAAPAEALYDEWDEAAHQWKKNWCRLTTRPVPVNADAAAQVSAIRARLVKTTTGLRRVFEQLEAARSWKLRQRDGSDVDIDAVVSRFGALKAGECSEDRLYLRRRRHSRDTAVLVLLDASLSTDAWVANRRVMDVEKEAVIALGDALDGLFDEVAVAAFCSQTRRDCRFLVAKGLHEDWATGAKRVASLEPHGFTRIGPALRHATSELVKCGAKQKLLLLVSDGKPSDIDRYEGRYGVADIHRAVLDAQGAGVVVHALAVDPAAKRWLPSMFGHGRASVVSDPKELVTALAAVTSSALRR